MTANITFCSHNCRSDTTKGALLHGDEERAAKSASYLWHLPRNHLDTTKIRTIIRGIPWVGGILSQTERHVALPVLAAWGYSMGEE